MHVVIQEIASGYYAMLALGAACLLVIVVARWPR